MKRIYSFLTLLLVGLISLTSVLSCGSKTQNDNEEYDDSALFEPGGVSTVFLVPMDGITKKQIMQLKADLEKKFFEGQWNPIVVDTLPHLNSTENCLNDKKTRLSSKRMIKFLQDNYVNKVERKAKENEKGKECKY